ncbi:hypothetical protein [Mycetohabitans sp. B46]|uniref:hypothetical protein n=1 Tax=Mycetohabitans sp. B46 TaxID=2772536 RepID=UPI00307D8020
MARTTPAGLVKATRAKGYLFRPNPQDAALLQDLSARLAAYCDSQDEDKSLKKNTIERHVRNLKGLSEWLMEQPEQSLTNVLARLEDGQLSDLHQQQLLTRYQAKPVGGCGVQYDAATIGASIRWLQKLQAWECECALDGIVLPGVATVPVPAAIDTQVKREMIAFWLARQSSTRNDKAILQQAPHLTAKEKSALRSLARWFSTTYNQKDKLDCMAKYAKPDMIDLITECYKLSANKSYKKIINGAIKNFLSGSKVKIYRNLDAQLHADDKLAIDIIKKHSYHDSVVTAFKEFAIWERKRPDPVSLAQIIANPAYQAHSDKLLKEFFNDKEIKPTYKTHIKREIPKTQESDELKRALSKLLS